MGRSVDMTRQLHRFWFYIAIYHCTCLFLFVFVSAIYDPNDGSVSYLAAEADKPTVLIATLVRNKEHVLPWFLYNLQNLDYPKNRIALWIRSDHNQDNSTSIIHDWLDQVEYQYHDVDFKVDDATKGYGDETGPCHWSKQRFHNVINLRQQALHSARDRWADYLFMLDADVILSNDQVLNDLILQNKTVVAPMLNSTASEFYSNFWGGMNNDGYYLRTSQYMPILRREILGCFPVANIHTAYLINLNHKPSSHLSFHPTSPGHSGPIDDIILFAHSAKHHRIPLHILNEDFYGYLLVPAEANTPLSLEHSQFNHLLLEGIAYDRDFNKLDYLRHQKKVPSTLGFDEIYMINLKRRPDRRVKMIESFKILGIKAKIVDAVDGNELTDEILAEKSVTMLPGYEDPYSFRPLTMGEIGCFLSHYYIWKEVVDNKYDKVIVFEDDIRFRVYFLEKFQNLMNEVKRINLDWDLIYLGRKKLDISNEDYLPGTEYIVNVDYTYWTLSYILTQQGAQKLLMQKPLQKMVPVDEYLPIMFDKHPEPRYAEFFEPRDLLAYSVEPLIVEPTHYTGEPGYITDTEASSVLSGDMEKASSKLTGNDEDIAPRTVMHGDRGEL